MTYVKIRMCYDDWSYTGKNGGTAYRCGVKFRTEFMCKINKIIDPSPF